MIKPHHIMKLLQNIMIKTHHVRTISQAPDHDETTTPNEVTTTNNEEATQNNDKQPHKKVMAFDILASR